MVTPKLPADPWPLNDLRCSPDRCRSRCETRIDPKNLVAESFALIETVIDLQEELGIRLLQEDLRDVETVGDLVRVCAERLD